MKKVYLYIVLGVLVCGILAAFVMAYLRTQKLGTDSVGTAQTYICTDGRSFQVTFSDLSAQVTLSDGRSLLLPQGRAASGIRYEADGIALIGKGNDAFIEEQGITTYADCVVNAGAMTAVEGVQEFTDAAGTFSFSYPSAFTVSGGGAEYTTDWMQGSQALGLVLAKVTVPRSFMPQTNFSEAYLTIGTSADPDAVTTCREAPEGVIGDRAETTLNGTAYTRYRTSDAGAGNLYETTSYRVVQNDQCYVVAYTIHSTNIGNYPDDSGITEFDRARMVGALESIVRSLTWHTPKY